MNLRQATIFGAGLIGGSVALAAREYGLVREIVAVDTQVRPVAGTPFDRWVLGTDAAAVEAAVRDSELTVLCVPVRSIIRILPRILDVTEGVVTDCGSTKASIDASLQSHPSRDRFVLGHPMAGSPQGGLENARSDLFQGRKWILCPENASDSALELVRQFVMGLGAQILEMDALAHDRAVAITSHVPQVVASALSIRAQEADALRAAGPGFASATRIAGGAEAMWKDIFETNAEAIGKALTAVGKQLETLGEQLEQGDISGALSTLESARKIRESHD